jgi:NADPH-dependent 2,4-dienoyl-CoA reductase/sulfur reductase-like enzyme
LSIEAARGHVEVSDLSASRVYRERFDAFVLATGARPVVPEIPGIELPGVYTVRTLDGAVDLVNFVQSQPVRHAVVVGGGLVGMETAESLRHRGCRVTVLDTGPWILSGYVDEPLARLVEDRLVAAGVQIRRERLVGIEGDSSGRVAHVVTDRHEHIGCQLVVVAAGIRPDVGLATNAGVRLGSSGAISVDEFMKTSIGRVWACGDCIEVPRASGGEAVYAPLSPTAFRTGHIAGYNAARRGRGPSRSFPGVTPAYGVEVMGIEIGVAGQTLAEATRADGSAFGTLVKGKSRSDTRADGADLYVYLVVSARTGRLLGAQVAGTEGAIWRANSVVALIRDRDHVKTLRDQDFIYTPPAGPSIDPLIRAASRAMDHMPAAGRFHPPVR